MLVFGFLILVGGALYLLYYFAKEISALLKGFNPRNIKMPKYTIPAIIGIAILVIILGVEAVLYVGVLVAIAAMFIALCSMFIGGFRK